jgi:hypothetical protein
MEPGARVCPFCGEQPGPGVFCAACGRNLADVEQLPTRREWELESASEPVPASPSPAVALPAFLAAMHAAGDPGAAKAIRAEPGFLGRAQHARGWVVRAVGRDPDDPSGPYEPGLFVTVEGRLHRLTSKTRGMGQRDGVRYVDLVGPEVTEPEPDEPLSGELAAVLRANGLDPASL